MKLVKYSLIAFVVTLCVASTSSNAKVVGRYTRIGTSRGGTLIATADKDLSGYVQTVKKIEALDNLSNDDRDIDANITPDGGRSIWVKLATGKNVAYPGEYTTYSAGNPYSLRIRTSNAWVATGCGVSSSWNLDAYPY